MKHLTHYIEKKKLFFAFLLITIQQLLNALGTYALAKAGLSFENREKFVLWTLASILLFILSPVINIFIRRIESILSFDAYRIFLSENLFSKSGNSSLWQSKNLKDRFLASIGSDASDYLGLVLFISMDIYSFVLSIVLGVLTLSFTIDMSLLPAFTCSGILSFLVYRKFSKKVEALYHVDQSARTALIGHLLKSWDNVLLRNSNILQNYQNSFIQKISSAQSRAIKSATASELLIFVLGLATGLPVLLSASWIIWNSVSNTQVLIALLATLPRQLNILGVFRNVFQSLTSLLSVEAKFSVLCEGTVIPGRKLEEAIKTDLITINQNSFSDIKEMMEKFEENPTGRFEVRGANGAGKSTFLLHLNHRLDNSVYLPTHPDLMIGSETFSTRSSGENLLAHIEALASAKEEIILLDEWDANLDAENLQIVNTRINQIAKTKTIVEVRHR
ncbi:ABC transporter ATP-binding protein [Bdellovibrio sp. SKB1291214]|uniref:ATP-binding cassette domain-containing protein n=1 Tax=Bdellovibrio sp. SKB1291214 TaxID=1732569 RepID=UPI000B51A94F|nr:ABC transporter ATP-binding protein [Bdellovibrio sp. SKB1291214]UYL09010.1 ABC transporter ATP-binding protein [Bdellovibrio sp. SKB1291214]